jgi:xanthine dehydrogenase accessory factor
MSELVDELIRVKNEGAASVLVTVVEAQGIDGIEGGSIGDPELEKLVLEEADARLDEERSKLQPLQVGSGQAEVFFEVMPAPPKLIVIGAGHIAVPLVRMARILDYYVIVIDDRMLFANRERFPDADEVIVGDMAETVKGLELTRSSYVVLITRGHKYDEPCLRELIHRPARYIGMIGSRRRIKACFERFRQEDKIAEELIQRVHAPIGLDIGTETPEEIALAILGEVIKVRRGGKAQSLSDR